MKYSISQLTYRTWIVEKEDGTEYFVGIKIGMEDPLEYNVSSFMCSCPYNSMYRKPCKHIRFILEFLATGKKEFEVE
uniref:SWIM-type domain-containing protein n=1 Tax=viral metagenome TaxID=1070528 RepID=A0A6H2A0R6_9ZZZZ